MSAQVDGKSYFKMSGEETPEEYLKQKRAEIESMTEREQLVSKTLLLVGQTLSIILTGHDSEMLNVLEHETGKLFVQAREIIKQGVDNVQ